LDYVDFCSLFDLEKAEYVFLSTYEFNPTFFERSLLNSRAISEAKRIAVFVDYDRYMKIISNEEPARYLNERYLLVPVKKKGGVFHPKLSLVIYELGASIFCGSNNLTQAGCTHNLELLNAIHLDIKERKRFPPELRLVNEAIDFFVSSANMAVGKTGDIAKKWIEELVLSYPWINTNIKDIKGKPVVELVHSFKHSPWNWFKKSLNERKPSKVFIISPFYDSDLSLLKRIKKSWPKCEVEITAQQRVGNLPTQVLENFGSEVKLFELVGIKGRILHAKLLIAEIGDSVLCLSGSANFTTAAMDGKNIEACFGMEIEPTRINKLFDDDIKRQRIKINDFEPGADLPPNEDKVKDDDIKLHSAVLTQKNLLIVEYEINTKKTFESIFLEIKRFREKKPIRSFKIAPKGSGKNIIKIDKNTLKEFKGAILCYLGAFLDGKAEKSVPVWLVHESKLTREPSGEKKEKEVQRRIAETGEGLTEYIEYILMNEGAGAVIEYLEKVNIKFYDGVKVMKGLNPPQFIQIPRDPTRSDEIPEWIRNISEDEKKTLEESYLDFTNRHIQKILQRHARRGNINGLDNFMDVYIAICKMMYKGFKRNIIKPLFAMDIICKCIYSLTDGYEFSGEDLEGYFLSLIDAHKGNLSIVKDAFLETNVVGHLEVSLRMAQEMRWSVERKREGSLDKVLRNESKKVDLVYKEIGMNITKDQIEKALNAYDFFTEKEKRKWIRNIIEKRKVDNE